MKINNGLTTGFLDKHPGDAARMLEQLSDESVTAFLNNIPPVLSAKVVEQMITPFAVRFLENIQDEAAALILDHMNASGAARLLKAMDHAVMQRLIKHLSRDSYQRIQRLLIYPSDSAGRLMDPVCFLLPETILVSDARKRITDTAGLVACEIYVVDDEYRLAGVVELGRLMSEKPKLTLKEVMSKNSHAISARAAVKTLVDYKAWKSVKTVPVVESDNTVVGILKHKDVLEAISDLDSKSALVNPSGDMIAVAGLYWNALTDIMDAVLSLRGQHQKTERG